MEDAMRRRPIPSFGNWDYCEEVPITQYFESASQAGLLRGGAGFGAGPVGGGHLYPPPLPHYYFYHHHAQDVEEDLFKVPAAPPVVVTAYPRKVRKGTTLEKQLKQQKQLQQQRKRLQQVREEEAPHQMKKQGRVCDCDLNTQQPSRKPKAVDEDLYKIPPELLYQRPKRKKTLMSEFLSRCLGLNCIP
ncbi:hypothetical protein Taro_027974 [Colocasia esculenta]|uniref:Uncharacterized protein n=1 Tax=Colocasia esculenta TaxID=4460 RepID=A0A843VFZ7_COLES|nr:hypothetical protein [Colocasia esculenta]